MITPGNLLFSKFTPHEFEQLCQLLCSVFETSPEELTKLYQDIHSTFNHEGWPLHFVRRAFFQSADQAFQQSYHKSPVVAVDLPSLMELDDGQKNKPTITIVGQDSKHNCDHADLVVGTPYGLHHKGSRETLPKTRLYFEMIQVLLKLGYRVYLTDLLKIWVCHPRQKYVGIKLPLIDQQRFLQLVEPELTIVQSVAVITWGKEAENAVNQLPLTIEHFNFLHPSSAANGAWRQLINQSPTNENKLKYWQETITHKLSEELPLRC